MQLRIVFVLCFREVQHIKRLRQYSCCVESLPGIQAVTFPADDPACRRRVKRSQGIGKEIRIAEILKIFAYINGTALQIRLGIALQEQEQRSRQYQNPFHKNIYV